MLKKLACIILVDVPVAYTPPPATVSLITDLGVEVEVVSYSRTKFGNLKLVESNRICNLINRKRYKRIYWVCQLRGQQIQCPSGNQRLFVVKVNRGQFHQHFTHSFCASRFTPILLGHGVEVECISSCTYY